MSSIVTSDDNAQWWQVDSDLISASAALVTILLGNEESRTNHVVTWLTSSSGAGVGEGVAIRRAILAALVKNKSYIEIVLEKSLQQFGDQLYIKHTPAMQQDGRCLRIQSKHASANILSSPRTGSPSISWICTPKDTNASSYDDEIRSASRNGI